MDNSTVLLKRLFSAKESGFFLIIDSLAQSGCLLISEFVEHAQGVNFVALSFETAKQPCWATHWIECLDKSPTDISKEVRLISSTVKKAVIVIDSLNYLSSEQLIEFIQNLMSTSITIVATIHQSSRHQTTIANYPDPKTLLSFIANAIFEVNPCSNDSDQIESQLENHRIEMGWNSSTYELELTHRRKSGRSIKHFYTINSHEHVYTPRTATKEDVNDEELMHDLTTFNLSTSTRQKLAREQVELPFMQAQDSLGSSGGAIVYEFEKDDDYDEEDPYEDPF
ncbi:hypothetical protein DIURU_004949 [Diutina rugosa]|uniref:Elongator complex protein 5 n=1 Tax=Diutina rugosa TaxID=5481 RepID=A0A642UMJ4_DIURU|nr:uncharacterized protein DIURU_004949 [Diutina rugosa]KAA8898095.1 hypothetical protein DIURU_004949 [Diutina rugosa]